MRLGLHISNFTWPDGQEHLRENLAEIATTAEAVGFDRLSVMDHVWQINMIGPPEDEMLESYTTLAWLAALTSRIRLLTLVTGVVYRDPGLLAKMVTTLDVLSNGRAMLGIGAAWNDEEAAGLGLFFPERRERFERLEEALQICLQMWSDNDSPFEGKHYRLARTLNSPAAVTKPHPPILIGGSGEKKTLLLVAKYAQSCNLFRGSGLEHKLDVLRAHCDAVGRNYDEIEKTVGFDVDLGEKNERVNEIVEDLGRLSELGFSVALASVARVSTISPLVTIGERIIPQVAAL